MNFLESIFQRCNQASGHTIMQEVRDGQPIPATGGELLAAINTARGFLRGAGLKKGDRCALLAPNSIRWAALDLAIMAEGGVVAPLYARQAPSELVEMMKDCSPSLLCCGDETLRDAIRERWRDAPPAFVFDEVFSPRRAAEDAASNAVPSPLADSDPVTIIYTSGTSGEAKGVILSAGNLN